MATQRKKTSASACDDTCIAGIISKAERGFATFIPSFRTLFPPDQYDIEMGTLYICTNKVARGGFQKYFKSVNTENEQVFSDAHCSTLGMALGTSFACELFDGIGWIIDIMPPELQVAI
jgi:hypothetical protein